MKKLLLTLVLLALAPFASAQGTIAPFPFHYFPNNSGTPCNGCQLFTYAAGTTTKQNTYTSSALSSAQSNPIVLNSTGRPTSPIFLDALSYKFVLAPSTDTDPPSSPIWTADNVSATAAFNVSLDISGTAGETLTANDAVYLSDGSGGLTAGRWYKADADNTYSSTAANALGNVLANASAADTISIRLVGRLTGLAGLSTSSLYYVSTTAGGITSSAPANARPFAVADSTTSIILSQWIPIRDASTTQSGIVTTGTQSFAGAKTFTGALVAGSTFNAQGAADFDTTTNFDGAGDFNSTLNVDGAMTVKNDFTFYVGSSTTAVTPSAVVYSDATTITTSGTSEQDGHSFTLPANALSTNGQVLRIRCFGRNDGASGTARTVKVAFGATVVTVLNANTLDATPWVLDAEIHRTGAATQTIYTAIRSLTTNAMATNTVITSATETLSGAITVETRLTSATSANLMEYDMVAEVTGY